MSRCTNTPEGAVEDAAGGVAGGAAGDIPDSAGFSLRQPATGTEIASKATDTVKWSRCALNDLLQIIHVHLSDGFEYSCGHDPMARRNSCPAEPGALAFEALGRVYLPNAKWSS